MILCLGTTPAFQRTLTFGQLKLNEVNRTARVHDYASGKSVNVARVVHSLGAEVRATGFVGGARGESLKRDLDLVGIAHDFVTSPTETRQCITVIDEANGTATELVEESSSIDAHCWALLDQMFARHAAMSKVAVLSGSLPPQSPQDFYARCIAAAKPPGCKIIVDAVGEPLKHALAAQSGYVMKLNRDELSRTLDRTLESEGNLIDAMKAILPGPNGAVVVTLGRDGAIATSGDGIWRLDAPTIKAVSAVGSGDAFAAGLAFGLQEDWPLEKACRLASACGAANALTAFSGHVEAEVVWTLFESVTAEKM